MKLNKKSKSKGKVHPSPSSSSSSSSTSSNDVVWNLNKLLPTTILTLISVLSLQDKEVLAYMITHSTSTTTTSFLTKTGKKKVTHQSGKSKTTPTFDCGCFDCYTSYWFRWDSSPHRELIHQAIEAFEEHLATSEQPKKITSKSSRKKENTINSKVTEVKSSVLPEAAVVVEEEKVKSESSSSSSPADGVGDVEVKKEESGAQEKKKMVRQQQQQQQQHKGLARKVLPDVIGLFNSRLWSLWGPNV